MQEQLTELQLKLAKEEEEKANVTKLNQDLKQVIYLIIIILFLSSSVSGNFSLWFSSTNQLFKISHWSQEQSINLYYRTVSPQC